MRPEPKSYIKPKKHLGQHFLTSTDIAAQIASIFGTFPLDHVVEIGPGKGILTAYLKEIYGTRLHLIEYDKECTDFLNASPEFSFLDIRNEDFLQSDLLDTLQGSIGVIGNYPYNISSQIVFRIIEKRNRVGAFGGMFQKEVAERLCAGPGNKDYGIPSVLLQAYYHTEYLFTVPEHVFNPPPKVKSGVMVAFRKTEGLPECEEKDLIRVVKTAFNQRRKKLGNALSSLQIAWNEDIVHLKDLRAEQLPWTDFVRIAKLLHRRS